jgi:putative acetyltransferase
MPIAGRGSPREFSSTSSWRRGYRRLYLETGALSAFAAGRQLYLRHGFRVRGPFGDYADDPNSVFMEKEL